MDAEEIETFKTVTGVDSDNVARGYLQIAGGSAMQAIQIYFDSPELQSSFDTSPSAPAASSHQAPPSRHRTGREDSRGVIHIDSDDDDVPMTEDDDDDDVAAIARSAQEEEDAAMARRLQEELYGSTSGGADDGVRAPIAQTTETLAAPDYAWGGGAPDDGLMEQLRAQRRREQAPRKLSLS